MVLVGELSSCGRVAGVVAFPEQRSGVGSGGHLGRDKGRKIEKDRGRWWSARQDHCGRGLTSPTCFVHNTHTAACPLCLPMPHPYLTLFRVSSSVPWMFNAQDPCPLVERSHHRASVKNVIEQPFISFQRDWEDLKILDVLTSAWTNTQIYGMSLQGES